VCSKASSWRQCAAYSVVFVLGAFVGRVDILGRELVALLYERAVIQYARETPLGSYNSKIGSLETAVFILETTRNTDVVIPCLVRLLDHPERPVRLTAYEFLDAADPPAVSALLRLRVISQEPTRDRVDREDAIHTMKSIKKQMAKWDGLEG
jgi:hypothetical protein